jgi:histidyl-tRNA synthetase
MTFQALPGFRDFYPEDCYYREHIFKIWRETSEQFGFTQYDGPPLEPLELFTAKSGEEIVHQLYNFTDKGDREIALRPEMTPTFARMAGLRHRDYKKPIKWYSIPQLFRYERAQRGRLREHFQWNCDIVGESDLGAEAELISLLVTAFQKMRLTAEDIVIRISDRQFWINFLEENKVPESQHYDFFQAIDKINREDEDVTRKKLGNLANKVYSIFESEKPWQGNERLESFITILTNLGLAPYIQIDLKIIRGLAYYTGIVFEAHDRQGNFRAIAGGGRYDNLLKQISGQDLPTVGLGMGDVVILELLKDKELLPEYKPDLQYFVVIGDEKYRPQALNLINYLRNQGFSVDYPLSKMKFNKQLELASNRNASLALIVDDNFEKHILLLKNLATREQLEIKFTKESSAFTFNPKLPIPCK